MDTSTIETTRRGLHAVAELVLAGPQYRASRTIKLLVSPPGFATLAEPRLRVDGTEFVAAETRLPLSGATCTALARAAGVTAGAPEGVYHDGSGVDPGEVLAIDPEAARWIEDCWAAGEAAMRRLEPDERPILWPEHFDVGIRAGGVSYGMSPGDKYQPEPYAYVTPPAPRQSTFWNAPFGAARAMRELTGADTGIDVRAATEAVLAFFAEGRHHALTDPAA